MPRAKPPGPVGITSVRASTVNLIHAARDMKTYSVTTEELRSLSRLNTTQAGFMSAATLLIGIALPDLYNALWADQALSKADTGRLVTFGLLALVCLFFAWCH